MTLTTPNWIPELESTLEGSASPFLRTSKKDIKVPEIYSKNLRVYIHLTLGAYSSSTLHSGLTLCAIPQMTQLQQLLHSWNAQLATELRFLNCENKDEIKTKLDVIQEEFTRGCDLVLVHLILS